MLNVNVKKYRANLYIRYRPIGQPGVYCQYTFDWAIGDDSVETIDRMIDCARRDFYKPSVRGFAIMALPVEPSLYRQQFDLIEEIDIPDYMIDYPALHVRDKDNVCPNVTYRSNWKIAYPDGNGETGHVSRKIRDRVYQDLTFHSVDHAKRFINRNSDWLIDNIPSNDLTIERAV